MLVSCTSSIISCTRRLRCSACCFRVLEAELDVLRDRQVGEQAVALEDHAHVALVGRGAGDVGAGHQHGAGVGELEAGRDAQRRGLAAPGRSEQRDELALAYVEVEALERDGGPERLADGDEVERGH